MILNIVNNMKKYFFYRYLEREKNKIRHDLAFLKFEDVKTIALINQGGGDVHLWEEHSAIYHHLKEMGKQVFMFTYCDEKIIPEHLKGLHQTIITKNNINWIGIPSQELQKDIVSQKFDLLIDLTKVSKLTTLYILTIVNARMRIGKNDEQFHPYFDFLIEWKEGESVRDFMEHIIYYLKIIKNR